jgi:arylsulfatase A-like enzyme
MPAEHRKARFVGREAARLIGEAAATGRPFVIYASFQEPHPPYVADDGLQYDPAALPVGPTFRRRPPASASQLSQWLADAYLCGAGWYGIDMTTEAGWRQTRASYLSNLTLVDQAVGDILAALEASGQADNTVVVYTSDHGDMLGDHAIFGKGVMYEPSVRVPLLIGVPWLARQPRRVSAPFSQIDLMPTLLELLSVDLPANLPGLSWASVLAGAEALARDIVIEWNGTDGRRPSNYLTLQPDAPAWDWDSVIGPGRTLLSPDGYKLNLNTRDRSELYHLPTDPYEQANLFDHPGQQARLRDLTGRLRAWQAATSDQLNLEGR